MKNIAVITTNLLNGYATKIVSSIQSESFSTDYDVITYATKTAVDKGGVSYLLNKIMNEKKIGAVVVIAVMPEKRLIDECTRSNTPVVLVENRVPGTHFVGVNNFDGGYRAGLHMLGPDVKKPGIVAGDLQSAVSQRDRIDGFMKAMKEKGMDPSESLRWTIKEYNYKAGKDAFRFMLMNDADAVFCAAGDYVAHGIISEAFRQKLDIPGTFALMGFDDIELSEEFSMTTVRQPLSEIGKTALEFAIKAAENPWIPKQEKIFDTEIVVRNTA